MPFYHAVASRKDFAHHIFLFLSKICNFSFGGDKKLQSMSQWDNMFIEIQNRVKQTPIGMTFEL